MAAAAKREGTVVIASSMSAGLREALGKGIREKYGLNPEVIIGRSAEFIPKIQAERRRGICSTDVLVAGISTILATLVPDGSLEPMDQFLMLPEVVDKTVWSEGQLKPRTTPRLITDAKKVISSSEYVLVSIRVYSVVCRHASPGNLGRDPSAHRRFEL